MVTQEKRQRSSNYPSADLAWAEDTIIKAHSAGVANRIALAQLVGHQDDTSGPARSKLAVLRHYRLVEYDEGKVTITELGKRLAAPMPGEDRSEALRESFFNVSTFKQLYDQCAKDTSLSKDALANVAIRQVRLAPKAAPDFVEIFTQSGVRAGLVQALDEKSVKILKETVAAKEPAQDKIAGGEDTQGNKVEEPMRRSGTTQAWNINLSIDSSMTPDNLRGLIRVLKEELPQLPITLSREHLQ